MSDLGMTPIPFLQESETAPVAWQAGRPVSKEEFSVDVAGLAARLPEGGHLINLCDNRYRFLVGVAAALQRGQITLLPPSRAAQVLIGIAGRFQGTYCLTDGSEAPAPLPLLAYPPALEPPGRELGIPAFPAEQIAVVAFTSGSTGEPQPHAKSWGSLARQAALAASRLLSEAGGVLVGTVPQQHMYGLESTIFMPLQAGVAVYAGRPFYPADLRDTLGALPIPRVLVTTPVHLRAYVSAGMAMPEVSLVLSATAPLSRELAAQAETLFGAPLHEIYGCTESGAIATRRTVEEERWRSYDGIRLEHRDDGAVAFGGHLAEAVPLNDVIELHSPERFTLRGRRGDLINVAGKRASLGDLNLQLTQIPGVDDGVFFMPEEAAGEVTRLMAFVVAPGRSEGELLSELRRRTDPVFLPRPLVFLDRLPRSETGKLPYARLAELAAAHLPRRHGKRA
jgi:acyl-coenzyme A synthetase/AMP-(fatty) acid ligase